MIDMANQGQSYVFDGPWSGNGTILVTNDTASASTLTFGGASGGNMANFTGSIIVVTNSSGHGECQARYGLTTVARRQTQGMPR